MLSEQPYEEIKHLIEPGDIIAFGGTSLFSRWTKFTTRSVVTHTAMVIDVPTDNRSISTASDLTMIEATSIKGKKGVMHNYVGERIKHYKGDVWWLPLHSEAKQQLHQQWHTFHDFLAEQMGKSYDIWQLFGAAIDVFDDHRWFNWITYNRKKFNRWFCSELVAEGLNQAGIVSELNPSETTPKDICQFSIYQPRYVQLKGKRRVITGYNSQDPFGWGNLG
ncbi:hypothetical protein [Alteromonas lipolytica]|uniref:Uncharacterized protein n=1 Tax=Alteromonas lipolytica TaxID=1856405 RepID=A0A1E8FEB0_9ALTE|nr:hypothetical protein [Alteromonas lipolytica]OFI33928.1 hypothetical protein BFC17_20405 [Alteromonas lipolytica]GGF67179.1 hypothetical protein GCM10011338_19210 [Alteromonas lipolytica]